MGRLRRSRGFTALELAMVVLIIGVLVLVFLFPRFGAARARTRATCCQSNLKQLALALQMYAYDHDGFFPLPPPDVVPSAAAGALPDAIWPGVYRYVQNEGVFACPSAAEPEEQKPGVQALAAAPASRLDYQYMPGHANDDPPDAPLLGDDEPRHLGGANVVFLSGEARLVSAEQWRAMGFGQQSETRGESE